MRNCFRFFRYIFSVIVFSCLLSAVCLADNNIEFLHKDLIEALNNGIFEVVITKKENDQITYARELPFDKLDFIERNEKYYSIGTAFFINDKELMTAAHVFGLEYFSLLQDFFIRDADGKVYPINLLHRYSTLHDMVVFDLKSYPSNIRPLQFRNEVAIGDTVFSVGNAQGEGIAYRAGQVASFTPEREYGKWKDIRFTSPASPGNSGGPLLNIGGEVVGIIVKKNQSENYNISVPIGELDKLTDSAEFHLRNLSRGLVGVDDTIFRDWSFSLQLPASVAEVASGAQESLNTFMDDLRDDLMEKVKDKNYPRGERFRSYLRAQPIFRGLAVLLPETGFKKWDASTSYQKKIPISASQNVIRGAGIADDLLVIIEKPEGITLKNFIDSPDIVMDNLLKGISFTRTVGYEKVPVTSFGKPVRSEKVTDSLGRTWVSSVWNLYYSNSFIHTSCLPYPKGVICNVDSKGSGYQKFGYFGDIYHSYSEYIVGYIGGIGDWQEYFAMESAYLPKFFQNSSLKLSGNRLQGHFTDISLDFTDDKITERSTIHFHMGYSNQELLAEDLVLFEIFPDKGAKSHYRIQPFFEPDAFTSDKYRSRWNDVIEGTGEFSGKPVVKGEQVVLRKALPRTRETLTTYNNTEIETIITTGCFFKVSDEEIDEECTNFLDSVAIE